MLYFEYFLKCKSDNQDDQFSFVFDALHLEFHIFSFLKKGKEIQGYAKNQYVDQYGDVNATAPSVAAVAYALLCVILMV